jgi:hypothetical protein
MSKPLDIAEMLHRGGMMTEAEVNQLTHEMTEAKLSQMSDGVKSRNLDQPLKVMPAIGEPLKMVRGYFTQQKYIWGKTPEEMETILGIFGKLQSGAYVFQFKAPLRREDYDNRAYSYLPDGKEYKPDPNEKAYLPGKGAPQWTLTRDIEAKCIARLKPGQTFNSSTLR